MTYWDLQLLDAVRLLRVCAPELRPVSIYMADAAEVTRDVRNMTAAGSVTACVSQDTDLLIRPHGGARGLGIILNRRLIEKSGDDVLALLTHEISHALSDGYLSHIRRNPHQQLNQADGMAEAVAALFSGTATVPLVRAAVTRHHVNWLRCALHLKDRLSCRCGRVFGVGEIVGYGGLLLPAATAANLALLKAREYDRLARASFAEIIRAAWPAEVARALGIK